MSWQSEFFSSGHSIEYLNAMDYWTFLELTDGINTARSEKQPSKSGKTKTKKMSKAQRAMMNKYKEQQKKKA